MRQIYKTDEIPHLWAHKTQPSARNAQRNLYFDGNTIYSYGSHFPIARHIEGAILFTVHKYSNTTAGHVHAVHAAIPRDVVVLTTDDVRRDVEGARRYHDRECARLTGELLKARSKPSQAKAFRELRTAEYERRRVYDHLNLSWTALLDGDRWREFAAIDFEQNATLAARRDAKESRESAARNARHMAALADLPDRINAWRTGGPAYHDFPEVMLRIEGAEVVTSLGARFPLEHARRAIPVVLRLLDKEWHRNGEQIRLGHYQIDGISDGVVIAGCHRVSADEVRRLAGEILLWDHLRKDPDHKDRRVTGWGTKTHAGLVACIERITKEDAVDYAPEVRQTACRHCGDDVEGFRPFPKRRWMDRGGNFKCNDGAHYHEGVL